MKVRFVFHPLKKPQTLLRLLARIHLSVGCAPPPPPPPPQCNKTREWGKNTNNVDPPKITSFLWTQQGMLQQQGEVWWPPNDGKCGIKWFPQRIFRGLKINTHTHMHTLRQRCCQVMRNRHRDEADESLFVLWCCMCVSVCPCVFSDDRAESCPDLWPVIQLFTLYGGDTFLWQKLQQYISN